MNVLSRRISRIDRRDALIAGADADRREESDSVSAPCASTDENRAAHLPSPLDELVAIYDEFTPPTALVEVVLHQPRDHSVPCQVPGHRHRTFAYSALCWDDAA